MAVDSDGKVLRQISDNVTIHKCEKYKAKLIKNKLRENVLQENKMCLLIWVWIYMMPV